MNIVVSKKRLYENYIIVVVMLLIFKVTPIRYLGSQWANTLVEVLVFISLVIVLGFNYNLRLKIDKIATLLIFILSVFLLTELRVFWGYEGNIKEIFNISFYTLLYLTIYSLLTAYNLNRQRIIKYVYILLLINITISIAAYHNPSFFHVFNSIFESSKSTTVGNSYQRFAGTFSNPNFFGVFFAIASVSFLYYFLQVEGKNIHLLISSSLCVYLVNISGSRSALLTLIVVLLVMFISLDYIKLIKKLKRFTNIFLLFILITLPLVLYQIFISRNRIINYLQEELSINSRFLNKESILDNFQGRLNMARNASNLFIESPFLGVGSSAVSIDNQYAKILMETGLIGFCLFVVLFIYILYIQIKKIKLNIDIDEKVLVLVSILFTVAFLFNMFGAAFFSVTQLTSLYLIMLAMTVKENKYKNGN